MNSYRCGSFLSHCVRGILYRRVAVNTPERQMWNSCRLASSSSLSCNLLVPYPHTPHHRLDTRYLSTSSFQSTANKVPESSWRLRRGYADNSDKNKDGTTGADKKSDDDKQLTLFQKFKKMYRDYWYVLIPVHCVTSAVWYGGFYFMAKSGVDLVPILEYLGAGETIMKPFKNSNAGYFALAYAMYKIATPARYAVTVGGTTISITYLKQWGWIKPVPTREEIRDQLEERRAKTMTQIKEERARLRARFSKGRRALRKAMITFRKQIRQHRND